MTGTRVVPPHGTRARYLHRNPEVRCHEACCRAANAAYHRAYVHYGPATVRAPGRARARQIRLPFEAPPGR